MRTNGANRHRVSHDPGYDDSHPNWSPDGSRIVFSRCSQFLLTCRVATMNLNGSGVRELTHGYWHDASVDTPVYSPDGTRIAFASDRGGYDSRIWVVRSDGTHLRSITPPTHHRWTPGLGAKRGAHRLHRRYPRSVHRLVQPAPADARKITVSAISPGSPKRFTGSSPSLPSASSWGTARSVSNVTGYRAGRMRVDADFQVRRHDLQVTPSTPDGAFVAAAAFQPDWSPNAGASLRARLGHRFDDLDRSRRWGASPPADTPAAGILRSMAALHAGWPACAVHQLHPRYRRRHLIDPDGWDSPAGDHAEQRRVLQRCGALAQRAAPRVHALACRERHDAYIHEGTRRWQGAAR